MHSVRAFRGLRFNTAYAAKLEKKREKARQREEALVAQKEQAQKADQTIKPNPFSVRSWNGWVLPTYTEKS